MSSKSTRLTLSVIIPVYQAEESISDLCQLLLERLSEIPSFEIVLVNDGSRDSSDAVCRALASNHQSKIIYLELSRNFSEHNAVMAGLNFCSGEFAVIIDDDFQNPPSEILKMLEHIQSSGADVVYSRYDEKSHHWFRNLGSSFNDLVASWVLRKPNGLYLSSFKIMRRWLIEEIIKYKGPLPYIDGLILRSTHHIDSVTVAHNPRRDGKSNYTFSKLVALWSNMFINFSIEPLRIALYLGFFFSVGGFFLAGCFFIERLNNPNLPLGWASTMIGILILSGVQLLIAGLVGEFIGRLYLTETGKPQYVIRSISQGEGE